MTKIYHGLTAQDLDGLPSKLLEQLNISRSLNLEMQIVDDIKQIGGQSGVDKIIIQHYKSYGEILDRQMLSAKLYRMMQKGILLNVRKGKGIYIINGEVNDE